MARTLVLGLGNPLRADDGAGPAVIDALRAMDLASPAVALIDGGTAGLETALLLQGYARAVIVDAAEMGLAPGEWRCWTPQTADLQGADLSGTLHNAGLAEALALADALDMLPETLIIYGIQPGDLGWSQELTEPLKAALPDLCLAIKRLVAGEAPAARS